MGCKPRASGLNGPPFQNVPRHLSTTCWCSNRRIQTGVSCFKKESAIEREPATFGALRDTYPDLFSLEVFQSRGGTRELSGYPAVRAFDAICGTLSGSREEERIRPRHAYAVIEALQSCKHI